MINPLALEALNQQFNLKFNNNDLLESCFIIPDSFCNYQADKEKIRVRNAWKNLLYIGQRISLMCIADYTFMKHSQDANVQSL